MPATLKKQPRVVGICPLLIVAAIGAASAPRASASVAAPAHKAPFKVSRATTYLTSPVLPSGRINYVAAINAAAKRGVTKANNAGALVAQTFVMPMVNAGYVARFYRALGIKRPLPNARYRQWTAYAQRHFRPKGLMAGSAAEQTIFFKSGDATMHPWTSAQHPRVAALLKLDGPALRLAIRASHRNKFYMPMFPDHPNGAMIGVLLPNLAVERGETDGLVRMAMHEVGSGRPARAVTPILAAYRLAALEGHQPFLICDLVAWDDSNVATRSTRYLLAHHDLRKPQEQALLRAIMALPNFASLASSVNVAERYGMLDSAERLALGHAKALRELLPTAWASGGKRPVRSAMDQIHMDAFLSRVRWNLLLTDLNRFYDANIKALGTPGYARQKLALDEWASRIRGDHISVTKMPWPGPPAGRLATTLKLRDFFISLMYANMFKALQFRDDAILQQRMVEIGLALAIYHADHHIYPKTIAMLTPKLLPTPLLNPFTAKPLIYRRKHGGYTLQAWTPVGGKGRVKTHHGFVVTLRCGK